MPSGCYTGSCSYRSTTEGSVKEMAHKGLRAMKLVSKWKIFIFLIKELKLRSYLYNCCWTILENEAIHIISCGRNTHTQPIQQGLINTSFIILQTFKEIHTKMKQNSFVHLSFVSRPLGFILWLYRCRKGPYAN